MKSTAVHATAHSSSATRSLLIGVKLIASALGRGERVLKLDHLRGQLGVGAELLGDVAHACSR